MRRQQGGVIGPTHEELREIAADYGFSLDDEQAQFFTGLIEGSLPAYRRVAELPDHSPEVKYPRTPGRRAEPEENSLNAWYWRCDVTGAGEGKLAGKRLAVKDPIAVAGVPTMAGSAIMEGFIPDADATVVTRMLDAGATITGKATCEDLCISGGSITSNPMPVRNPHDPTYGAGGSSSGSAALVAAGEVDMALGADQGGSIRLPAAQCGVVGLKATYGLVPYSGIFPIENSLDHVGPICRTVEDTALLLEVIAGRDDIVPDPRQHGPIETAEYTKSLTGKADGLTVGILKEGFGMGAGLEDPALRADAERTDAVVREAARAFEKAGAKVKTVSVPMHADGPAFYTPIFIEGIAQQMMRGNGFGVGHKGWYPTQAMAFYGKSRKAMADSYSDLCKLIILMGEYMFDRYHGRYYAKAQNQMLRLKAAYDTALRDVDVLVMPTCAPVGRAMKITEPATPESYVAETFQYHLNACAMDATGHPALTVPCGKVEGMPVGMMMVGRHFDEATLLRGAHAFEQLGLY